MTRLDAAQVMQQIRAIPSLSQEVLEVLELLNQPVADYAAIERSITRDPGLAGRVLRLANSSFYGLAGKVSTFHEACLVLGTQVLRQMVTAVAVAQQFPSSASATLDRRALWLHAMGVGCAAKVIAAEVGAEQEQAFTAGLLHDLGKLALDATFPEVYGEVLALRQREDCYLREAEQALFGVDHAFVGARLAEQWHLPHALIRVLEWHHTPDVGEPDPLVDSVHLGNILARALGVGYSGDDLVPPIATGAWQRLGLAPADIRRILTAMEAMLAEGAPIEF